MKYTYQRAAAKGDKWSQTEVTWALAKGADILDPTIQTDMPADQVAGYSRGTETWRAQTIAWKNPDKKAVNRGSEWCTRPLNVAKGGGKRSW